jgi:hypothetical protein
MLGFYTYKHVFNILLVLNVEVSVFQSVNSAWVGLYNKCGYMHGATLKKSNFVLETYRKCVYVK